MAVFDPGPPAGVAAHFDAMPTFAPHRTRFWYDWGPVFYRGRLDRSARLLGVASDPGPTERVACRTLVGDAGQRVQGFLAKLGLTRSYALLNAYPYALLPSASMASLPILAEPAHRTWRNELFAMVTGPQLQAIVSFGLNAQRAVELWDDRPDVPVVEQPHPSSRDARRLVDTWRAGVTQLRAVVDPDPDGDPDLPNYGTSFRERDYARIPAADLPYGLPAWFGDDAWGRKARPRHNNAVERPSSDLKHTLVWRAPLDQP